jgi:hypothetical protein
MNKTGEFLTVRRPTPEELKKARYVVQEDRSDEHLSFMLDEKEAG